MMDIWRYSSSGGSDVALPLTDSSSRRIHRNRLGWLLPLLSVWLGAAAGQDAPPAASAEAPPVSLAMVNVVLRTSLGDIHLALEKERAPITVNNFLHYVDQKRLDGTEFYRALKLDDQGEYGLIQGGLRNDPRRVFKPIAHEPTGLTGLSHFSGAILEQPRAAGTGEGVMSGQMIAKPVKILTARRAD